MLISTETINTSPASNAPIARLRCDRSAVTALKQWQDRVLALGDIKLRPDFQLRAKGINPAHAAKLQRALENGNAPAPVKVAAIGKALCLVDGFHRYAAHQAFGSTGIGAQAARMTLEEGRNEVRLADINHGLNLTRADMAKVWEDFVEAGGHFDSEGAVKSPYDCRGT